VFENVKKLRLHGFNNLTKTLSVNVYDICYTRSARQRQEYLAYIDGEYNATRLTRILTEVSNIIGANILNIAHQDYDPQGASVTMLICEEPIVTEALFNQRRMVKETPNSLRDTVVAHLDKSHITVHTYPESHPQDGVSTFRVDIDVSTCGRVSPLRALNFLIHSFDSDIVTLDYRVRGFTRDVEGQKHYIDHEIHSIQKFIAQDTQDRYQMMDANLYQENIFHTKMMLKEFDLNDYLFDILEHNLDAEEVALIRQCLKREMTEIFYGRNLVD